MKSVGEVMAMGRTWQESVQKALRGMETGLDGFSLPKNYKTLPKDQLLFKLRVPNPERFIILKQVSSGERLRVAAMQRWVCLRMKKQWYRIAVQSPMPCHSHYPAIGEQENREHGFRILTLLRICAQQHHR